MTALSPRRFWRHGNERDLQREADLYVLWCAVTGRLKIGIPTQLDLRLAEPPSTSLRLLGVVPKGGKPQKEALLQRLASWGVQGEWLEPAASVLAALGQLLGCDLRPRPQ